jgi:hypothetical protein
MMGWALGVTKSFGPLGRKRGMGLGSREERARIRGGTFHIGTKSNISINMPTALKKKEAKTSASLLAKLWRKCMGIEPTYPLPQKVHRI